MPDALSWDTHWSSDCNQLEFVTDNETLASILNGRALVKSNEHEHVLRSSINHLERMYSGTFVPRCWALAPVLWRPRQHNKLADGLVNCAMNHKRDAEWQSSAWGHSDFCSGRQLLQIHTDGRVRQNDACSGTAFTVTAFEVDGASFHPTLLYASCRYDGYRMSAFRSEAMAIDDALAFL